MKPTRPEVPIELDIPRTLKLDFNATVAIRAATVDALHPKGMGWIVASGTFEDYINGCIRLSIRKMEQDEANKRRVAGGEELLPDQELTEAEVDAMEPPALVVRGLLYALLQHQWMATPPTAPPLTLEELGRLIDFDADLLPICVKIRQAIEQNSAPPAVADEVKQEERPANGQSPLSPPMEPTSTTTELSV